QIPAKPLWHVGDMRANVTAVTRTGHVAAEHLHTALLDRTRTCCQSQQAGFADPIGADKTHHATPGNIENNITQRTGLAIGASNALKTYDRGVRRPRLQPRRALSVSASGHGLLLPSLSQAMPGKPVLTTSRCLRNRSGSMRALTRNISFWRSLAASTVFGGNCAVHATNDTSPGTTNSGDGSGP